MTTSKITKFEFPTFAILWLLVGFFITSAYYATSVRNEPRGAVHALQLKQVAYAISVLMGPLAIIPGVFIIIDSGITSKTDCFEIFKGFMIPTKEEIAKARDEFYANTEAVGRFRWERKCR